MKRKIYCLDRADGQQNLSLFLLLLLLLVIVSYRVRLSEDYVRWSPFTFLIFLFVFFIEIFFYWLLFYEGLFFAVLLLWFGFVIRMRGQQLHRADLISLNQFTSVPQDKFWFNINSAETLFPARLFVHAVVAHLCVHVHIFGTGTYTHMRVYVNFFYLVRIAWIKK